MKRTARLNLSELVSAYRTGESASSLARRYGVSVWSIITRLRQAGVEIRSAKKQNEKRLGMPDEDTPFTFSEVVDGVLLGDGQIDPKGILHIDQSIVRAGWLGQVQQQLQRLGGDAKILPVEPRTRVIEGREVHSQEGRHLYTPAYVEMQEQRRRWYPSKVKELPPDLRLTGWVLSHWFAGDGTGDNNGSLRLCTNNFTAGEVDALCSRLSEDFGIHGALRAQTPREGQYTLGIYRGPEAMKVRKLLEPLLPACCQYKLRHVRPRKYSLLLPEQVREIRRRAAEGVGVEEMVTGYGKSATTIRNVIARRSYKDIR